VHSKDDNKDVTGNQPARFAVQQWMWAQPYRQTVTPALAVLSFQASSSRAMVVTVRDITGRDLDHAPAPQIIDRSFEQRDDAETLTGSPEFSILFFSSSNALPKIRSTAVCVLAAGMNDER
jgi:hypothetical protein